jgi:hypothetical protein
MSGISTEDVFDRKLGIAPPLLELRRSTPESGDCIVLAL